VSRWDRSVDARGSAHKKQCRRRPKIHADCRENERHSQQKRHISYRKGYGHHQRVTVTNCNSLCNTGHVVESALAHNGNICKPQRQKAPRKRSSLESNEQEHTTHHMRNSYFCFSSRNGTVRAILDGARNHRITGLLLQIISRFSRIFV
jgi:hypothetical protein